MPARCLVACYLLGTLAPPCVALEYITVRREATEAEAAGRVVVEAQDGGVLLLARDGVLWAIQPTEIVRRRSDHVPFRPFSAEEMAQSLLAALPQGFRSLRTAHYVILYGTSPEYAAWCGSLFERLYMAFVNYWGRRGLELSAPEFPLVAVVFSDQASYIRYARQEVGESVSRIHGHFNLQTNRMTLYDLTGAEARAGFSQIESLLARPDVARNVATIVHEATHQIAFNCGLHARFSDVPMWVSEGIAVYFETPDLRSAKGWSTVGAINRARLVQFRDYLTRRPADSLRTLVADDRRLQSTDTGPDAYAEAWALTYFLLRRYPVQFVAYLKGISQKKPMIWDDPETRLHEFRAAFGDDLERLDAEFIRYMARLR